MPYPNFLCIGAQKSGTTWLHHHLNEHNQIWMPPIKELHYFDRPHIRRYIHYVFKQGRPGTFVRNSFSRLLLSKDILWALRFFCGERNDDYYNALFKPQQNEICGEITPAYLRTEEETIARISKLMPDVKIICLLRNPVERAWSHINMYRRRAETDPKLTIQTLFEIKRNRIIKNSSYCHNLKIWEQYFKPEQFFIGYYEQLEKSPLWLLNEIYDFLDVERMRDDHQEKLFKKIHSGNYNSIPFEFEHHLSRLLLTELEETHAKFNNEYTYSWLKRASFVLNN